MNTRTRRFYAADIFYLFLTIAPIVIGMTLKILFTPQTQDITICGAMIYFTIHMPFATTLPITESQINSLLVVLSITGFCLYITHGITEKGGSRRQTVAEWIVDKTETLVLENMGNYFLGFAPFIAAIMMLSACSSLLTLFGMYPPTSDLNTVGGWALLVFCFITYYKNKCGPVQYLKSFTQPVAFLTPLNVISEIATPISMAFRHYGNILSGSVISVLVAAALKGLSAKCFGNLPGILGKISFFSIGLPAVLSVYFDIFSGLLQAFIFAMITMLYIAGGFPQAIYEQKHKKTIKTGGK